MDDLPSPSVEIQVNPTAPDAKSVRHDRPPPLAFIADARTEAVLREGLASILPDTLASRRGGVRAAIAALKKMPTPQALVVDVSGEDQPLQALADLSEVVEPTAPACWWWANRAMWISIARSRADWERWNI